MQNFEVPSPIPTADMQNASLASQSGIASGLVLSERKRERLIIQLMYAGWLESHKRKWITPEEIEIEAQEENERMGIEMGIHLVDGEYFTKADQERGGAMSSSTCAPSDDPELDNEGIDCISSSVTLTPGEDVEVGVGMEGDKTVWTEDQDLQFELAIANLNAGGFYE